MKLELKDYQKPHFKRMMEILIDRSGALDLSKAGLGKTIIAIAISMTLKMPLFVICPKTMISSWKDTCQKYGATIIEAFSYQSFKGKKGLQPSHPYLTREDIESYTVEENGEIKPIVKTSFKCTEIFKELLSKGILFICDEFQEVKNNSAQSKAVAAVIEELIYTISRYLFLSRTPLENINQAIHIMRVLQFIDKPRLYYKDQSGKYNYDGALEIISICDSIDREKTDIIIEESKPHTQTSIKEMCFKLFYTVLIPEISSSMVDDKLGIFSNDTKNGFYIADPSDLNTIKEGIKMLDREVEKFLRSENNIEDNSSNERVGIRSRIIPALKLIEVGKIGIFSRKAIEDLSNDDNCKVLIALNFTESITKVYNQISSIFPCEILSGSVQQKKRKEIIDSFQENSNKLRCIIFQIKVGGVGISLHDIYGNHPRKMYISPGYEMSIIYQASMRIYRQGIKSNAETRIVYVNDVDQELRILDALSRKTETLKKIISTESLKYDKFPGDFDRYIEEEVKYFDKDMPRTIYNHISEGVFGTPSYRLYLYTNNKKTNFYTHGYGNLSLSKDVRVIINVVKSENYILDFAFDEDNIPLKHMKEDDQIKRMKVLPNYNMGFIGYTSYSKYEIKPVIAIDLSSIHRNYGDNIELNVIGSVKITLRNDENIVFLCHLDIVDLTNETKTKVIELLLSYYGHEIKSDFTFLNRKQTLNEKLLKYEENYDSYVNIKDI